jgi:tetratricopeptide (TPR) repeat protein
MNNGSKITSFAEHDLDRFIRIQDGTMNIPGNAMIENIEFKTELTKSKTWTLKNISFNNVNFTRVSDTAEFSLNNCHFANSDIWLNNHKKKATVTNNTFTDCNLYLNSSISAVPIVMKFDNTQFTRSTIRHYEHKLEATNCTFNNSTIRLDGNKPAEIVNCTFTDTPVALRGTTSSNPEKIEITTSTFVRSLISHMYYMLKATNCTFSERSDIITEYSIVDIQNCNFWKSGFMATAPNVIYNGAFTPSVKITNSSFGNTGKFVIGLDMSEHPIYSTAAIRLDGIKNFDILGNTIVNANASAPKGIPPEPHTISQGEGIYLNNAGNGSANNQRIQGNDISQCETALYVYNSKAQIYGNEIHGNTHGARLFNNSQTTFEGFNGIIGFCDYQIIHDNGQHLYASEGSFPNPFQYNQISNTNNNHTVPWIYYDVPPLQPGQYTRSIDVRLNCWGDNFVAATDLHPTGRYLIDPTWCPWSGGGKSPASDEELYQLGLDYFSAENYATAKTTFLTLIATYPQSEYAISSLHELFALEQFADDDYAALRNYYATFTSADTALFDVADFLATRCNVWLQNWQPAIEWYEGRIETPPSYPDSVFAVIDLGDIHLSMERDTLKAARVFRFPNLVPMSRKEYEENKTELLATLPRMDNPQPQQPLAETGKKGVLNQNIPNPATGSTTIVYDVIEEGAVELRLYNQLGQLLQALPQGTKKAGSYRTEVSLAGLPAGMYHYALFVDGEKADGKKMIVTSNK